MSTTWSIVIAGLILLVVLILAGAYLMNLYFDLKYKFYGKIAGGVAKILEAHTKQKEAEKNGDKKDI